MSDPATPMRVFGRGPNGERSVPVGVVVALVLGLVGGGGGVGALGRGGVEAELAQLVRKTDQVLLRLDGLEKGRDQDAAARLELDRQLRELVARVTRLEAERDAARPR